MLINPQIVLTLDHAEYAQLVLFVDYVINEDAVITPEMYASAVLMAIKFGLKVPDSDDPEEEPGQSTEPKLH